MIVKRLQLIQKFIWTAKNFKKKLIKEKSKYLTIHYLHETNKLFSYWEVYNG